MISRVVSLAFLLILAISCGEAAAPLVPADADYTVEGYVQRILGTQGGFRTLEFRHQAIADFRNKSGEVVGMDSMAMPFSVAPEVSIEGLETNAPVSVVFEVRWEADPVLLITSLTRLEPGTTIELQPSTGTPSKDSLEEPSEADPPEGAADSPPSQPAPADGQASTESH